MISNEMIIRRHGQGVRLDLPRSDETAHAARVASIMELPMNFYFMDCDSVMMNLNDKTAESCGYISAKDAVGKSLREVSSRNTFEPILANDREIISTKLNKIISESYTRLDGLDLTAISIKFPWLCDHEVVGIFGCSILLGYENAPDISEALSLLMQSGLMASDTGTPPSLSGWTFDGIYFDQRDKDILYLLVRGKTAKNIAKILGLSFRTIEHRLEAVKQKLSVSSKSELIERIIDQFIVTPG